MSASARGWSAIALAVIVAMAGSCTSATDAKRDPNAPATVVATPDSFTLVRGDERYLVITVRSAAGSDIATPVLQYSSSAPTIASVSLNGLVHANFTGVATITVSSGDAHAAVAVTVSDPDDSIPVAMRVLPGVISIRSGEVTQIVYTVVNKWNVAIAGTTATWTSNKPEIVTVSPQGLARGGAAGTATITGTVGDLTRYIPVYVRSTDAIIDGTDRLVPGAESSLTLMAFDSLSLQFESLPAVWSSSDSAVLSVSSSGVATGRRNGEASIVAVAGKLSARVTVTVAPLSGTIAYRAQGNAVSFIRLDGSAPVSVAIDAKTVGRVALSPDGTQLAYDCDADVCLINIRAGTPSVLVAKASDPSWTADGTRVAVRSGYATMAIVPVGGGTTQVVRATHYVARPHISASGALVAFECDYNDPYGELSDLCIQSTQSASPNTLLFLDAYDVAWSPRADSLALVSASSLCVSPVSDPRCGGTAPTRCGQAVSEPAWSPDGSYLVLVRLGALWITDVTGRTCMRFPQTGLGGTAPTSPTWGNGTPPLRTESP